LGGVSAAPLRLASPALAVVSLASGCCSSGLFGASQPEPPPEPAASANTPMPSLFRERMAALFLGRAAPPPNPAEAAAAQPVASDDCPTIDIRSGASTYAVGASGADPTATTLRFQATVARTARDRKSVV